MNKLDDMIEMELTASPVEWADMMLTHLLIDIDAMLDELLRDIEFSLDMAEDVLIDLIEGDCAILSNHIDEAFDWLEWEFDDDIIFYEGNYGHEEWRCGHE